MQPQQDYCQLFNSMLEAFDAVNLNYFVMEIICDENGVPVDGIYREVSPSTVRLIGKRKEEIIGKSRRELFGNISDEFPAKFYEVIHTGQPVHFQTCGAATKKYYDVYAWKVADMQVAATVSDITEHKKTESELEISQERFSKAFSASPAAISISRLSDGMLVDVNGAYLEIFGFTREEVIGKTSTELGIFTNSNERNKLIREVKENGRVQNTEVFFKTKTGEIMTTITSIDCIKVGNIDYMISTVLDITERKKAEEAVKATLNRFYKSLSGMYGAILLVSENDQVEFANRSFCNYFGFSEDPSELKGWSSEKILERIVNAYKNPEVEIQHVRDIVKAGKPVAGEEVSLKGNRTCLRDFIPLQPVGGGSYSRLWHHMDITPRKKAEEALKVQKEQLERTQNKLEEKAAEVEEYAARMEELVKERTEKMELSANYARELIETSLDPLVTISREGKITDVNKATEIVTGCCREELIGSNFSDYFTEPKKAEAGYKKVLAEGYVRDYPLAIKSRTGETTEVLYNAAIYHDKAGKAQGVFAAARDITERKKLEKQLHEKDRLAAIGATAGMVGHDIRNPLQSIIGEVFLAKAELEGLPDSRAKKEIQENLNQTESNIDYINKIVQDLQDYARPLNPKAEDADLQQVLEHAVNQSKLPENINTYIKVDPQARKIKTDTYYLNRILYNLITNSVQAMTNGGELTIRAQKEGKDTVIAVTDTGAGIPKDVQPKMFTVMFTTKSKGQGFGLPVVKRMTESLGGSVSFESQEGKGTTFTLKLPTKA